MNYASLDELNKDFAKRIKDTEDEGEQRELRMQQREATIDFREIATQAAALGAHKATAVAAAKLEDWADMVTGLTTEEIDASVAKIVDRLAKTAPPAGGSPEQLAAAYGAPGSGAGGAPSQARKDDDVEKRADYEKRFNESSRGSKVRSSLTDSPATVTVREGEEFVRDLFAARAIGHLAQNSASAAVRGTLSRIDTKTLKERV